jgi:hypothetical protein
MTGRVWYWTCGLLTGIFIGIIAELWFPSNQGTTVVMGIPCQATVSREPEPVVAVPVIPEWRRPLEPQPSTVQPVKAEAHGEISCHKEWFRFAGAMHWRCRYY